MSHVDDARSRRARVVVGGHVGDVATVTAGLEDPDPSVRAAAIGAAARIGTLDAATLSSVLDDPDPDVRTRACRAAAGYPDALDVALPVLVDRLDDPVTTVTEVACFACGERNDLDERGIRRLVELVTSHDDALVRESAVAALGSLAGLGVVDRHGMTDEARDAVVAAGADIAPVRRRAAVASAAFDGPAIDALVERLCGDRDQQVRQIAEDLRAIESPVVWLDRPRPDAPPE